MSKHEKLPLTEWCTHHRLYDSALPTSLNGSVSEWLWQRDEGDHKYGDHPQPVTSETNGVLCTTLHWAEIDAHVHDAT